MAEIRTGSLLMEDYILLTQLNDFIFCPVSIYFHNLYGNTERLLFQGKEQLDGTEAHKKKKKKTYRQSHGDYIIGLDVFSEKYNIAGKIDIYNITTKELIERKKKISQVYDGYVFQLFGQYYCMMEMGYEVRKLSLYSMDDNKSYTILFNFVECLLQMFGFDVYQGFLHRCFYMRKSLVCDMVEPFRPIIDWKIRCAINLGQITEDDFEIRNHQYFLKYKKNPEYCALFTEEIMDNKAEIFSFVQEFYRNFMKGIPIEEYTMFG